MEQVIQQAKASNELAVFSNRYLRFVLVLFVLVILLVLVVLFMVGHTFGNVTAMEKRIDSATEGIQDTTKRLSSTEDTLKKIKTSTDKADDARETQPRIELVTEDDPMKAVNAPLKVRITPPVSTVKPASAVVSSTVEVPLPVKDAVKVPLDDGERR